MLGFQNLSKFLNCTPLLVIKCLKLQCSVLYLPLVGLRGALWFHRCSQKERWKSPYQMLINGVAHFVKLTSFMLIMKPAKKASDNYDLPSQNDLDSPVWLPGLDSMVSSILGEVSSCPNIGLLFLNLSTIYSFYEHLSWGTLCKYSIRML